MGARRGSTVLRVHASDPDAGQNGRVRYRLSKRTQTAHGNLFGVDAASGDVRLLVDARQLQQSHYVLGVLADDHGDNPVASACSVSVAVLDVNDVSSK